MSNRSAAIAALFRKQKPPAKSENAWWGGTAKVSADGSGVVHGAYINGAQSYQTDFDRNRGKGGQQIWQEYQHEFDVLERTGRPKVAKGKRSRADISRDDPLAGR